MRGNEIHDSYVKLTLFDYNAQKAFSHDIFNIEFEKNNMTLFKEKFLSLNGTLTLWITPTKIGNQTIFAEIDPSSGAWIKPDDSAIHVIAPIFAEGGLYHIHVDAFSINNTKILNDTEKISDFYFSVADVVKKNFSYHDTLYNVTVTSFYDKISNFGFDPSNLQFSWSIPFDWNFNSTQIGPRFVHEEISIPNTLVHKLINTTSNDYLHFNANINSIPLDGRRLINDPYSSQDYYLVHLVLNKLDLIKFKEKFHDQSKITYAVFPDTYKQEHVTSPLKQFKSGILPENIKCNQGFLRMAKLGNLPVCLKPQTAQKLLERGWGSTSVIFIQQQAEFQTIKMTDTTFSINYTITGGKLLSVNKKPDSIIELSLNTTNNGEIKLKVPTHSHNKVVSFSGIAFFITIDGKEIHPALSAPNNILSIKFPKGTKEITIGGTMMSNGMPCTCTPFLDQ